MKNYPANKHGKRKVYIPSFVPEIDSSDWNLSTVTT